MANRSKDEAGEAGFDPVALTLAIWLGLIVGVLGVVRVAERAADQAAATRATAAMPVIASAGGHGAL